MFGSEQTIYIYRIDSVKFLCRNLLEHRGSPEIRFMQGNHVFNASVRLSPDGCHHEPAVECRNLPSDPDSPPRDEVPSRIMFFLRRLGVTLMSDSVALM